ncbi:O-glucosyltransferase rumi homolog [Panonychus citri]|uniref:O-glucosyltransferase rumi homolog n=1 Tax=Panonychus citri TaxID=50023 RepID=UPI002307E097|nr:O-glucosyltransferase rumi homolog [Panonychus citri]
MVMLLNLFTFLPLVIYLLTIFIVSTSHETISSAVNLETINQNYDDNGDDDYDHYHEKAKYYQPDEWIDYMRLIKEVETINGYQCDPKSSLDCFSPQIESDLSYWMEKGITFDDIESAKPHGVHYQIIDHQLYRQPDCMFPTRCEGIEHFLLQIINKLPDIEMIINVRDWPVTSKRDTRLPIFSFSRDDSYNNDILYPAWSFWSGGPAIEQYPTGIGRFDLLTRSIVSSSPNWESKEDKCFFRGSRTSSDRDWLILLSQSHPDLIDAQYTKNQAWRSPQDTLGFQPSPTVTFEDHCNYKYLINLRGVAASFRYKHLFLCQSLVFNVQSNWIEFFYHSLVPWYHYVPVNQSNFLSILTFFIEHQSEASTIASNGFKFINKHLNLITIESYWHKLLTDYSTALKYKPKLIQSNRKIINSKRKS